MLEKLLKKKLKEIEGFTISHNPRNDIKIVLTAFFEDGCAFIRTRDRQNNDSEFDMSAVKPNGRDFE